MCLGEFAVNRALDSRGPDRPNIGQKCGRLGLKPIKSHINDKLTTNQQKEFRDFSFVNDELFNSTVSDLAENLTSALWTEIAWVCSITNTWLKNYEQ